jgi:translation initiation factor IF-1
LPVEVDGEVIAVLPNSMFRIRVRVTMDDEPLVVLATISGRLRQRYIKLSVGDWVFVELSPYDPTRGRITRYKLRAL